MLPRIRAKRPVTFLRTAADSILNAIGACATEWRFQRSDTKHAFLAGDVLRAVVRFALALHGDPWTMGEQGQVSTLLSTMRWAARGKALGVDTSLLRQCTSLLIDFLCSAVARVHPFLRAGWAEAVFLERHPRYRIPGRQTAPPPHVQETWAMVMVSAGNSLLLMWFADPSILASEMRHPARPLRHTRVRARELGQQSFLSSRQRQRKHRLWY